MKKWKTLLLVLVVIMTAFGTIGILMFQSLQANMKQVLELPINELDVTELEDGIYTGQYYYEDQIGATLQVTITNHKITKIEILEHICGKGEIAEVILDDIITEQSVLVDDIAGVTTSSHVLKLAVQDALKEDAS